MKRLLILLAGVALCAHAGAQAQSPAQQYIRQMLSKAPLQGTVVGIAVQDAQGKPVALWNEDLRLSPASNTKLVTTGCALHAFGPDYRFKTSLGYTGTIQDGTLEGDLYILGGGDPTLGAKDSLALKPEALFWKWKNLLKIVGIERINGRIVGDGTAYEGHLEHASWSYDDLGTYYGTGTNALSFYQNAIDYAVTAGAQEGDPVGFVQTYPETPWMHTTNYGVTGPEGSGNTLYLYTTDLAPYAQLRGVYALDRRPKTEHFANKYGALTCAYYFWKYLKDTGWTVTGGYADIDRSGLLRGPDFVPGEPAGSPVEIAYTESPRLKDIARVTNFSSDNFYAESFLRAMGEAATGIASYDSCLVALSQVLTDLGVSQEGIRLADGSGLSRMNYLSAQWTVNYLQAMRKSPAFEAFLSSLPAPGQGTLNVVKIKGGDRIRMKSGSMDGVLCYSGYILGADGAPRYTFSILTNNATAKVQEVRAVLVGFLEFLLSL